MILMYAEFVKARVTTRTMSPAAITVDEKCERMTITDLHALAFHGERVFFHPETVMPYNNQKLGVNPWTPLWSKDWDLWSIGIMSLEVIVGSELVLPLRTYRHVEDLMADIMPHIPFATYRLLHEMLFEVRDQRVVYNAKGEDFERIYTIQEAIKGVELAKKSNPNIQRRLEGFIEYSEENAEYL